MKPLPTKADLRKEMEQQIEQYLHKGGMVQSIPRGQSGREGNDNPFSQFGGDRSNPTRTPLNHVVQAIEDRKHPPAPQKKRPRKKLITDDFGEPLRWVWVDE